MSKVFFIGDLHFDHKNICAFEGSNRGGVTTVDKHNEWIIRQWNSVVSKQDIVWVMGDVSFSKSGLENIRKCNGQKNLILGNHDTFSLDLYSKYFNRIHGFMGKYGAWLSHAPIHERSLRNRKNIHGHMHSHAIDDDRYICVSVERLDGVPWELEKERLCPDGIEEPGTINSMMKVSEINDAKESG